MNRRKLFILPVIAAGLVMALCSSNAVAAGLCQPVQDSTIKGSSVARHLYQTETRSGQTRTSEAVYVGNDIYILLNGKWRKSPLTKDKMLNQEKENLANAKNTSCRVVRDEMVNGVPTTLYAVHSETEDDKLDTQVWLSKSSGLPVKEEIEVDVGGGPAGKSHKSIRFEYTNVKAPI